jgi:hypothetical protein
MLTRWFNERIKRVGLARSDALSDLSVKIFKGEAVYINEHLGRWHFGGNLSH